MKNLTIKKSCTDFVWHFYGDKSGGLEGVAIEVLAGNCTPGSLTVLVGQANHASPTDGTWEVQKLIKNDPKGLMEKFEKLRPNWSIGCVVRNK